MHVLQHFLETVLLNTGMFLQCFLGIVALMYEHFCNASLEMVLWKNLLEISLGEDFLSPTNVLTIGVESIPPSTDLEGKIYQKERCKDKTNSPIKHGISIPWY